MRQRPRRLPMLVIAATGSLVVLAAAYTPAGRLWTAYLFVVLDRYIGVVTLIALSVTIMAGLASTDRLVLRIGHRILLQGVHRAAAIVGVVALGVHIAVKVLEAHAGLGDVVVPFFSRERSLFIGFGTIASYLLLLSFWAGLARRRFVGRARPWFWRVLHSISYLCWPIAMLHGLNAGREAATWVIVSYLVCLVMVVIGLLVRLYTRFSKYAVGVKPDRTVGVHTQTVVMPRIPGGFGSPLVSTGSPLALGGGSPSDPGLDDPPPRPRRERVATGARLAASEPYLQPRSYAEPGSYAERNDRRHLRLVPEDGTSTGTRVYDVSDYWGPQPYRPAPTADGWAPAVSDPGRPPRDRHGAW